MDSKELAKKTYEDLKKRKAAKEKAKEKECLSYMRERKESKRNVMEWHGRRIH